MELTVGVEPLEISKQFFLLKRYNSRTAMSDEDESLDYPVRRDFYPDSNRESAISQTLHEKQGNTTHSSCDQQEQNSSIGSLYLLCENEFRSLVEELCKVQIKTQLNPDSALDQFDRLKLWAGNLGTKHAAISPISLDWRLKSAPDMKMAVIKLLDELVVSTKSCELTQCQRCHTDMQSDDNHYWSSI